MYPASPASAGGPLPNLGIGELLIVLAIVILLFGATRLPQLGEGLGQGLRSLKRAISGDDPPELPPES